MKPEHPENTFIELLHRANQVTHDVFLETLGSDGPTPRQLAVLGAVSRKEGASQTDIVAMTGIDRSTLADVVKRLTQRGLLVRRRTKHDARAYSVRLTADGEAVLARAAPLAQAVEERLLTPLDHERRRELLEDLEAVATSVRRPLERTASYR